MNAFDNMKISNYKGMRKPVKKNYAFTLDKDIIDFFKKENSNVPLSNLINEILKNVKDANQEKNAPSQLEKLKEVETRKIKKLNLDDKFGFIVFDIIKDIQFSKMAHKEQIKYLQKETRGGSSY